MVLKGTWQTTLPLLGEIWFYFYKIGAFCKLCLCFITIIFSFFPNVLQPPMSVVGNSVYKLLVKARLCRRTVKQINLAVAPTGVTVSLPGLDPHDMERRR